MKLWKIVLVAWLYSEKIHYALALASDKIPFGPPTIRLPENDALPIRPKDRSRYRHNYPINPLIRNAANNQAFPPVIWDLASTSYPIDFFLYTKDNPYLPEVITVNNGSDSKYFDRGKPSKFIIHDFMQSSENAMIYELKDAYMNKKEDFNVILVDWEPARTYTYTVAVTVTEYVGKMAARIVQIMKMDPTQIHAIGLGLGAHAAGVMGNDIKQQNNISLARITGLDPSLPLFRMAGNYFKLDPEDASFVDVIHTDGGDNLWNSNHLGMGQECGHVDVYPNRGIFQPGCRQSSLPSYEALQCSHVRALEIYKESVQDELSFVACRCPTWTDFAESRCNCRQDANRIFVGEACPSYARRGNYYLVTEEAPPYGLGGKGTLPVLTKSADPASVVQNFFSVSNGSLMQGISQIAAIFTSPIKPFLNTLVRNAEAINNLSNNNNNNNNNNQNILDISLTNTDSDNPDSNYVNDNDNNNVDITVNSSPGSFIEQDPNIPPPPPHSLAVNPEGFMQDPSVPPSPLPMNHSPGSFLMQDPRQPPVFLSPPPGMRMMM